MFLVTFEDNYESCCSALTRLLTWVTRPTNRGASQPVAPPEKVLLMPNKVPAKFGARSMWLHARIMSLCELCSNTGQPQSDALHAESREGDLCSTYEWTKWLTSWGSIEIPWLGRFFFANVTVQGSSVRCAGSSDDGTVEASFIDATGITMSGYADCRGSDVGISGWSCIS